MITVDDDITVDGSSTTCSSPILYRQTGPVEGEEAGKWTQGTQNTQNNMSQLEALAELDSMLEPTTTHFVPLPCATANKSLAVPVAGKRKRALPELLTVFARVDRQSYSSLSSAFEVSELRLLLHASGFPVPSSTTKASCIEKLIKLHQEGSLRGLALGPANPPTHNTKAGNADDTEPPASWPVPLEGEGVYWESSAQHWRSLQDGKRALCLSSAPLLTTSSVQMLCRAYWSTLAYGGMERQPTTTLLPYGPLSGSRVAAVRSGMDGACTCH